MWSFSSPSLNIAREILFGPHFAPPLSAVSHDTVFKIEIWWRTVDWLRQLLRPIIDNMLKQILILIHARSHFYPAYNPTFSNLLTDLFY